jgi:hypothetical protein
MAVADLEAEADRTDMDTHNFRGARRDGGKNRAGQPNGYDGAIQ